MKVAVAVILAVLISSCEAQKGGAKSAMRNRGRGGSSGRGGSRGRNNYADSGSRGPDDNFGNGTGRRACVGLCYLRWPSDTFEIKKIHNIAFIENFKENRQGRKRQRKRREGPVSDCATGRNSENSVNQGKTKLTITCIQLPIYLGYLTSEGSLYIIFIIYILYLKDL